MSLHPTTVGEWYNFHSVIVGTVYCCPTCPKKMQTLSIAIYLNINSRQKTKNCDPVRKVCLIFGRATIALVCDFYDDK